MQPTAVQPGAARPKPPPAKKAPPTRRLQPGDLVCGQCGEGNDAVRKFCSRCGNSLATAESVKTPWWRKVMPKRRMKTLAAGQRPGTKGGQTRVGRKFSLATVIRPIRMVVSIVLLLGGILYSFNPAFRAQVNEKWTSAKSKVMTTIRPEFLRVSPSGVTATSELPGPPGNNRIAAATIDGFKNTAWAAPATDPEPTLVFQFQRAVDLDQILVTSGDPKDFQGQPRPEKVHLVYSNGKTQDLILKDSGDPQRHALKGAQGITFVEFHITSKYTSLKGAEVTIAEVELFTKKG